MSVEKNEKIQNTSMMNNILRCALCSETGLAYKIKVNDNDMVSECMCVCVVP